VQPDIKKITYL